MILPVLEFVPMWNDISEQLKECLPYTQGELSLDDIFDNLGTGRYQLWSVDGKGWAVTTVASYSTKKSLFILALVGNSVLQDLTECQDFLAYIKEVYGVTELEARCRTSMVRLACKHKWQERYTTIALQLGD